MNIPKDGYCSTTSRLAGEQLFATASQTKYWLLLEDNSAWGAKAFEESQLPEPVKTYLSTFLEATPNSRLLLIKRLIAYANEGIRLYLVNAQEQDPQNYQFQLGDYQDLLDLDLPTIFSGEATYRKHLQREPVYLICTNGKRDSCCAKYGIPTYSLLSGKSGITAWQCSHMGGHRFAANMLCYPHGICYGRVGESNLNNILHSYPREQLILENYRGRACYPEVVQAADFYLREKTGNLYLSTYHFLDLEPLEDEQQAVLFSDATTGEYHRLHLQSRLSDFKIRKSCGDEEIVSVKQFYLTEYFSFDSLDKFIF